MNAKHLIAHFDRLSEAANALPRLRELVVAGAIRGGLATQDSQDEPVERLLERIGASSLAISTEGESGDNGLRLPESWARVHLISLGAWAIGSGFPKTEQGQTDGAYFFLKVSDMNLPGNEREITVSNNLIDEAAAKRMKAKLHPAGTIIFPKIGGAIATNKRRILTRPSAIDNNCLGITFSAELSLDWCFLLLTSLNFAEYQAGTAVPALQQGVLGQIVIGLPPREEQERIVAKVDELITLCDELEDAHRNREQRRDRLSTSSQSRMVEATSDPETFRASASFYINRLPRLTTRPDHISELRRTILDLAIRGRLSDSDKSCWTHTTLGKIGQWGSGGTPNKGNAEYYGGDIPWLVIGDLNEGLVTSAATHITQAGLDNSSAKLVQPGTVLIAMYGSIGKLGIAGIECATNQAIAHCVPDARTVSTEYLTTLLKAIRRELITQGKGGTQQNISQTILKAHTIRIPPLAEQGRIVAKVDQLMALCDELEAQLREGASTRSRLLEAVIHEALTA